MTTARPDTRPSAPTTPSSLVARRHGAGRAVLILVLLPVTLVVMAGWHLTQGTSGVGTADLINLLLGRDATHDSSATTLQILMDSRIPRLAAGIAVGFALGVAGALLQSLARNPLAAPDTLAITGGAYFAVTVVAAIGLSIPVWASGITAFVGGIAAAALVMALAGGPGTSPTRLILAGSAVALALQAGTSTLLILFEEETTSLFAWGSGSLSQLGLDAFSRIAPIVVIATACSLLIARRLDVLTMGDDTAAVLGTPVRSTRAIGVVLAVLLTASAITLAGPIGFVGLCAPAIVRLLGRWTPTLNRHALLLPVAGLMGATIVVSADVIIRATVGVEAASSVPTGVTTTLAGAIVLIALARSQRSSGAPARTPSTSVAVHARSRFVLVLAVGMALWAGAVVVGLLGGHQWLYVGDITAWLGGDGLASVRFALDERAPRVAVALLAGGALALAGTVVQSTCRNPLAEPGLLGITGGAGVGAVIMVTGLSSGFSSGTSADTSTSAMIVATMVGALLAFAFVYALAWRGGLDTDRLVLIGIGTWYGTTALSTFLLVRADPWNTPQIYTWLSGSTYGATWQQVAPVGFALLVTFALAVGLHRELDLLALDDDSPRLVGMRLERARLLVLTAAALLTATAVTAVGVVGFVGLVAPHIARGLVGSRCIRVAPVALLVGAFLLVSADAIGRVVISPAQIPAGLVVALIGAPYFVVLLARSRG